MNSRMSGQCLNTINIMRSCQVLPNFNDLSNAYWLYGQCTRHSIRWCSQGERTIISKWMFSLF